MVQITFSTYHPALLFFSLFVSHNLIVSLFPSFSSLFPSFSSLLPSFYLYFRLFSLCFRLFSLYFRLFISVSVFFLTFNSSLNVALSATYSFCLTFYISPLSKYFQMRARAAQKENNLILEQARQKAITGTDANNINLEIVGQRKIVEKSENMLAER